MRKRMLRISHPKPSVPGANRAAARRVEAGVGLGGVRARRQARGEARVGVARRLAAGVGVARRVAASVGVARKVLARLARGRSAGVYFYAPLNALNCPHCDLTCAGMLSASMCVCMYMHMCHMCLSLLSNFKLYYGATAFAVLC
jgi:hypothetical protein